MGALGILSNGDSETKKNAQSCLLMMIMETLGNQSLGFFKIDISMYLYEDKSKPHQVSINCITDLCHYRWCHGSITRMRAESLLSCRFNLLVRLSESDSSCYILSVK